MFNVSLSVSEILYAIKYAIVKLQYSLWKNGYDKGYCTNEFTFYKLVWNYFQGITSNLLVFMETIELLYMLKQVSLITHK